MQYISHSRSLLCHEEKLNALISTMIVYLLKMKTDNKTPETPSEVKVVNYLNNLSEKSLSDLIQLVNVINSGIIKRLNKFVVFDIITFDIKTSDEDLCGPHISVEYALITKPKMYRKITKKLKSEDAYITLIKQLFENSLIDLSFLIDTIIDGIDDFDLVHDYIGLESCLNETESLIRDISLDIVSKFTTNGNKVYPISEQKDSSMDDRVPIGINVCYDPGTITEDKRLREEECYRDLNEIVQEAWKRSSDSNLTGPQLAECINGFIEDKIKDKFPGTIYVDFITTTTDMAPVNKLNARGLSWKFPI